MIMVLAEVALINLPLSLLAEHLLISQQISEFTGKSNFT